MFDRPNAKDGTVTVLVPEDEIANMPRQSLVKIKSYDRRAKKVDGEYIAMVVAKTRSPITRRDERGLTPHIEAAGRASPADC